MIQLALLTILATGVTTAGPPIAIFDKSNFLHQDLYDYSPEQQAAWEASRYSQQALRIDLGSISLREVWAIEEAQANLRPVPWFAVHLDLQDDRTREEELSGLSADVAFRVAPRLELIATGNPDIRKDRGALGLGAMIASDDHTQYAVARVTDDSPFFNSTNPRGGVRNSSQWRVQSEVRAASQGFSGWLKLDWGSAVGIRYPADQRSPSAEGGQRAELHFHLRWVPAAWMGSDGGCGLRGTFRLLSSDRTDLVGQTSLRRVIAFGRAYAMVPLRAGFSLYAVLLGASDRGYGRDADLPFTYVRWDLGARASLVKDFHPLRVELGYSAMRTQRAVHPLPDPADLLESEVADKAYGSIEWHPRRNIYLRFLISHQVVSGNFAGMNGLLGAIF